MARHAQQKVEEPNPNPNANPGHKPLTLYDPVHTLTLALTLTLTPQVEEAELRVSEGLAREEELQRALTNATRKSEMAEASTTRLIAASPPVFFAQTLWLFEPSPAVFSSEAESPWLCTPSPCGCFFPGGCKEHGGGTRCDGGGRVRG